MRLFPLTVLILCGLVLAGCATGPKTAQEVLSQTQIRHDSYAGTTWVLGPTVGCDANYGPGLCQTFLRRGLLSSGKSFYQLYVMYFASDWVFFDRAYDSNGNIMEFVEIDREVTSGGSITEDFAVMLPDEYITSHAATGLNIQVRGKRGSRVVQLAPFYVQGFLDRAQTVSP